MAVRIFPLRTARESQPEAPAEQVATREEIVVGWALQPPDARRLTVRAFVRGVAKRGGFLGRQGDGEPGVLTQWRGYQRLQELMLGYHLQPSVAPTRRRVPGNR